MLYCGEADCGRARVRKRKAKWSRHHGRREFGAEWDTEAGRWLVTLPDGAFYVDTVSEAIIACRGAA